MHTPGRKNGFTLLELAIVVLVGGLIMGAAFSWLDAKTQREAYQVTVERQKKIAIAISNYIHMYGKFPCAAPFDNSVAPEALGEKFDACSGGGAGAQRVGIVPFRSLGLTREDAIDGYGRPFTYAVSQAASEPPNDLPVYHYCRRSAWIDGGNNVNRMKAQVCCREADWSHTLEITDGAGIRIAETQNGIPASDFKPDNDVSSDPATDNINYFAYVIVSHGKNGLGAPVFFGNRRSTTDIGGDELANASGGSQFRDAPFSTAFDDIVLWRTQTQAIAETGNDSCGSP